MAPSEPTSEGSPADDTGAEPRAPIILGLLAAIAAFFLMPDQLLPGPTWVLPVILGCFLVALLVTDPGRIDRRSVDVRRIRVGLVVVLVAGTAWATAGAEQ